MRGVGVGYNPTHTFTLRYRSSSRVSNVSCVKSQYINIRIREYHTQNFNFGNENKNMQIQKKRSLLKRSVFSRMTVYVFRKLLKPHTDLGAFRMMMMELIISNLFLIFFSMMIVIIKDVNWEQVWNDMYSYFVGSVDVTDSSYIESSSSSTIATDGGSGRSDGDSDGDGDGDRNGSNNENERLNEFYRRERIFITFGLTIFVSIWNYYFNS
jgi:hypothetical protein